MTYVEAESETWNKALAAVIGAIIMGSTDASPIEAIFFGPTLTEQFALIDFFDTYKAHDVVSNVEIDGEARFIREAVFSLETQVHSFFVDYGILDSPILWIDDMRQIDW